jgi:hypothetical protein
MKESDSYDEIYDDTFSEVTELLDIFIKNPHRVPAFFCSSDAAGDLYSDLANLEALTRKRPIQARSVASAYRKHIKDLHSKGKEWPRLAAFLPDWLIHHEFKG